MKKHLFVFLVFICVSVLFSFSGCGTTGQYDQSSYDSYNNTNTADVDTPAISAKGSNLRKIVVFSTEVPHGKKTEILEAQGCVVLKHLNLINATVVMLPETMPSQTVEKIKKFAEVKRVDDDVVVTAIGKPSGPGGTVPPAQVIGWGITQIKADQAWNAVSPVDYGYGVKAAVVDTGIDYTHTDLSLNVKGGINTISSRKDYKDDNGHGTHVAGIIAAQNNEVGVVGVGPQVYLYGVKVLDRNGSGWLSDIIEGLEWCIVNQMQVVNMSLGTKSDVLSFHEAVAKTYQAGITIVVAAGNEYGGAVNYPAKYSETIAVSASDQYNQIASFSSVGPEVDLIAPGVNVNSTYKGGGYAVLSGTSMASPHVAGTVALKLYLNPALSPDEVMNLLKLTADNIGLSPEQMGSGLVDAHELVLTP